MKNSRKKGQGVVELALVLPIFLFVIIGIVDFGRALHSWACLNYQCVQAARAATKRIHPLIGANMFTADTHTAESEVTEMFWKYRSPMMAPDDFSGPLYSGVGTGAETVTVSASFNLSLMTPVIGKLVGGSSKDGAITISASASEDKE
jgi:hypothetical protein